MVAHLSSYLQTRCLKATIAFLGAGSNGDDRSKIHPVGFLVFSLARSLKN